MEINGEVKSAQLRKEVRQGCPSSPIYATFHSVAMEEMKQQTKDVRINGQNLHCIRFTDDIALVAERPEEMNKMLNTHSIFLTTTN